MEILEKIKTSSGYGTFEEDRLLRVRAWHRRREHAHGGDALRQTARARRRRRADRHRRRVRRIHHFYGSLFLFPLLNGDRRQHQPDRDRNGVHRHAPRDPLHTADEAVVVDLGSAVGPDRCVSRGPPEPLVRREAFGGTESEQAREEDGRLFAPRIARRRRGRADVGGRGEAMLAVQPVVRQAAERTGGQARARSAAWAGEQGRNR